MRLPLPRELHRTDRPSATAQWTTLGRALELTRPLPERIVSDPFAPYFLSGPSASVLAVLKAGSPAVHTAERSQLAAVATSSLCRHRFIDEHLVAALPAVERVLLLGAGYDSRAYRLRHALGDRPVYEIDLPPISRRKATIVAGHPDVFGRLSGNGYGGTRVERVETNFRTDSLTGRLTAAGFRPGRPTAVVWEGVAMYLTRDAVSGTLAALAELCGPGSVLAMDCWQHVAGWWPYDHVRRVGEQAIRLIGEPITFAAAPQQLAARLSEHGFAPTDLATADVLTRRYATAGRSCEKGLYVVAAERR